MSHDAPWSDTDCTLLDPHMSAEEILAKAGLDWQVVKVPLSYTFKPRGQSEAKMFDSQDVALVRETDGHELSTTSGGWYPVQNEAAFDFFHKFCVAYGLRFEIIGSLKKGEMVWGLAKMPSSFTLFDGKDLIENYILFSNPHQYGRKITICLTPIRDVCKNTLTLSLSDAGKSDVTINLHHRTKFDMAEAAALMNMANDRAESFKSRAEFLASRKFTSDDVGDFFRELFHTKGDLRHDFNQRAQRAITSLVELPGAEIGLGTWWHALNAVTYTTDHVMGRSPDTRLFSAWYGTNRALKDRAIELAVEYAERSAES